MANRAPVLTLWAAVVAEVLGFEHDEALTLGRAGAGLNAYSKGVSLGLFQPTSQEVKEQRRKMRKEETLPVESVAEYFKHFPLLEIDYTFYRPLLEKDGKLAHGRNVPEEELATTFNSYRLRLRQDCYSGFHLSKPILLQTH